MATKYYWHRKAEVIVETTSDEYSFKSWRQTGSIGFTIGFQVPFNQDGTQPQCSVTIQNLSKDHEALFKKGRHIILKAGYNDNFGVLSEGTISSVYPDTYDGTTHTLEVHWSEGKDYSSKAKVTSTATTTKTSKKKTTVTINGKKKTLSYTTKKKVHMNLTFKKGTKASTIINRISRDSGIPLAKTHLKTDVVYKKGYTVSAKPEELLKEIATKCGSQLYYRRADLVIDDLSEIDGYAEHVYLTPTSGLIEQPSLQVGDDGKVTYSIVSNLNPSITAGSIVEVNNNNGVHVTIRVTSGTQDGDNFQTQMEGTT